jgi:histidyl-tRNA synthetase
MKPSIPKGTRDFSPDEVLRRDYIFNTIKQVFRLYGYQPIETPAMESLVTLLGKYGEEGDRLLFRILNSGDFLSLVSDNDLLSREAGKISSMICEKGLRYDLTVPFARYVVQHREEITFPFRRYQLQPVWRGDRPQKGRYREFFQCDADVIGSDSLLNEYELIRIIDDIFGRLDILISIKLNNRKILSGIAEIMGESARMTDITVAIDKLEKIGMDSVIGELRTKGVGSAAIEKLRPVMDLSGGTASKLDRLRDIFESSEVGQKGVEEVRTLFSYIEASPVKSETELDLTLARGLNYYTGAIIEVKAKDVNIGSVCGGGRYDNLTGVFGLEGVSGVGVSFGADRIYDVLAQIGKFGELGYSGPRVLILNFGNETVPYALNLADRLRKVNINAEFYPDSVKLKKQISYADIRKIPYVLMAGENEMKSNRVTIKIMSSGEQKELTPENLIDFLKA